MSVAVRADREGDHARLVLSGHDLPRGGVIRSGFIFRLLTIAVGTPVCELKAVGMIV
jgi:hypothetical protein